MNGPEHYRRAEQLEQLAVQQWEKGQPLWQLTMQQAQVHATLALAAATAANQATAYDGDEHHSRSRGWAGVA